MAILNVFFPHINKRQEDDNANRVDGDGAFVDNGTICAYRWRGLVHLVIC